MSKREHRTSAAGVLVALAMVCVAASGCVADSKPTEPIPLSELPSPRVPSPAPSAPSPLTPSPSAVSSSAVAVSPSVSPALPSAAITGASALASAFPKAAAAIPAAIQTVRNFFEGRNHELDTGDIGPVSATYTSQCMQCIRDVAGVQKWLADGHTIRGGHGHIVRIDGSFASGKQDVTVRLTESQDGGEQLDAQGHVVRTFSANPPTTLDFDLNTSESPPVIWQLYVEPA